MAERGESRLLVVRRGGGLEDRRFPAIVDLIPPGDLLVLNTTRVRHARFLGTRPSGAAAEVLLIHPSTDGKWIAIGKPGSALRAGKRIAIDGGEIETVAVLDEGFREVRFVGITAEDAIARAGRLPLPPYIERAPTAVDEVRYQTVYAEREGSVAAPTAGCTSRPPSWTRSAPRAWPSCRWTSRWDRGRSSRWRWWTRPRTRCTRSATPSRPPPPRPSRRSARAAEALGRGHNRGAGARELGGRRGAGARG